jgi:hypothetical protein
MEFIGKERDLFSFARIGAVRGYWEIRVYQLNLAVHDHSRKPRIKSLWV